MRTSHQAGVQRWLQQHCESSGQVAGGLVMAAARDDEAAVQPLAEWPAGGGLTEPLAAAARAAADRSRPLVIAPAGPATADAGGAPPAHNRVISMPLRDGDRTLGAVALAVQAADGQAVSAMVQDLERASAGVGALLGDTPAVSANPADAAPAGADTAARVLTLQQTLLAHDTLADGVLALLTALAPQLGADRVMLGALEGGRMELLGASGSVEVKGEQELFRLVAAAMHEAADQGVRVEYPAPAGSRPCIVHAHAELHLRSGLPSASVPLVHGGRAVGALLAEWRAGAPAAEALALLDGVAAMLGPLVVLGRRAERRWTERTADLLRAGLRRLTSRHDPLPKLAAAGTLAALAAAFAWPVPYHVGAAARIEGAVQRVVAAPIDGYLNKSHVRPGDTVRAGDLLVELADQDLLLEKRRWEGALAQHENGIAAALARADRAQFVVAQGKAGEARAQLELVRQQLARTKLVAPIDGVVIKGDLSQTLGAPVQRGDALLTLAPAERHRLVIDVDERDIASVRVGQRGELALASRPGEPLAFRVERVTPVAAVRDGHNTFAVEARLQVAEPLLRPGLEGVAKISAGEQSAAWIAGHRALDWLRLALWSWAP